MSVHVTSSEISAKTGCYKKVQCTCIKYKQIMFAFKCVLFLACMPVLHYLHHFILLDYCKLIWSQDSFHAYNFGGQNAIANGVAIRKPHKFELVDILQHDTAILVFQCISYILFVHDGTIVALQF